MQGTIRFDSFGIHSGLGTFGSMRFDPQTSLMHLLPKHISFNVFLYRLCPIIAFDTRGMQLHRE